MHSFHIASEPFASLFLCPVHLLERGRKTGNSRKQQIIHVIRIHPEGIKLVLESHRQK